MARRNYGGGNLRQSTMNDMPTPQGDFFHHHAARQRTHNAVLAVGVVMFTSTLYFVRVFAFECLLINLNLHLLFRPTRAT
jgi:Deltamethrin resistance